mgnify:CR=1 FL=1
MPLNADQLHAFWTVVQTGSYHRAAEALFVTQSAITQRIQALENALGQKLFIRVGRGFTLTEAGRTLSRYCREQSQAEDRLRMELQGGGNGLAGRLSVASGSVEGCQWLLPEVAKLGREHPDLDITLRVDEGIDPVALLESGKVDAVLSEMPLRRRGIRSTRIGTMAYQLTLASELGTDWPDEPSSATLKTTRIIDFSPRDRVTLDHLERCLPGEDVSDLRRHFVNDTMALLGWILAGGGTSALPIPLIRPHLEAGRLRILFPGITTQRPLYWASPEGSRSPAAQLAMERLKERLKHS